MKKAVIRNRIILHTDTELGQKIIDTLTHRIPPRSHMDMPKILKLWNRITASTYSIPSGREDLIPEGYEIIDKRADVPVSFPEFKFTLRPSQLDVYNEVNSSCIINAAPSYGKTFTALALLGKLKQKALVVTHTTALRDQWAEEVEKVYGFSPGIIGSGRFDIVPNIVIANTQTLVKKISEVKDKFGALIIDECHHTPSSTFTEIVDKMESKYKIGLSGTLVRKDGQHVVLPDYFSSKLIQPPSENAAVPVIFTVDSKIKFPEGKTWADRVTNLECYTPEYQNLIVKLADLAADAGHKVLVVGSRVEFLEKAPSMCRNSAISITGSVKDLEERNDLLASLSSSNSILFGTMSIFSEGISQNDLSCLILATPINNDSLLEQLIGRVVRIKEGKKQPVVFDIHLDGAMTKKQAYSRMGFYMRKGFEVKKLT